MILWAASTKAQPKYTFPFFRLFWPLLSVAESLAIDTTIVGRITTHRAKPVNITSFQSDGETQDIANAIHPQDVSESGMPVLHELVDVCS